MAEEIERCPNKGFGVEFLEHLHRYRVARMYCAGKRVLDAACGSGYGSAMLAEAAASVKGIDISEDAVRLCRQTYSRNNLEYLQGSIAELPFADRSFDVIVSFETIEHVPVEIQKKFLQEIRRVLVPGGILIMSSPDKQYYTIERQKVNPYHVAEFFREEFIRLIEKNFKYCTFADQRIYLVSLLKAAGSAPQAMTLFSTIPGENGHPVIADTPVSNYWYNIAVASDQPVSPLPDSLNLDLLGEVFSPDGKTPQENYIEKLHAHIQELDDAQKKLLAEREEHLVFIEESKTHIDELDAERETLLSERAEHLGFIGKSQQRIKELDAERAALVSERTSLISERETLLKEREDHLAFIEESKTHIDELDAERETLLSERTEHLGFIGKSQQRIKELDAERAALVSERTEHLGFIGKSQQRIKELDAERTALVSERTSLISERETLLKEREDHLAFIEESKTHIDELDAERETLLSERTEHLGFIGKSQQRIKELDAERTSLISERETLLKEREDHLAFIEKSQAHIAELDDEREKLLAERREHIAYIDKCIARINEQNSEKETLLTDRLEHIAYINKCHEHIGVQDTQIGKLQEEKAQQMQEITDLKAECCSLTGELDITRKALGESEAWRMELQQELERLRALPAVKLLSKMNLIK